MIIRIHNTGDPYKLPTLSVHIGGLFLFLSSRVPFFSPPFIPSLFLASFPTSSLPTCRGNNHSARFTGLCPSFFLLLLPSRRHAACLFPTLFPRPVNIATLPCYLPTPRSDAPVQWLFFFTLDTWSPTLSLSLVPFSRVRAPLFDTASSGSGEEERRFCARRKGERGGKGREKGWRDATRRRRRRPRHTCACEEVRIGTEWKNEPTVWRREEARSVVLPAAEISLVTGGKGLMNSAYVKWIPAGSSSRRAFVPRLALLVPRSGGNAMLILDVGSEAEIHGDRGEIRPGITKRELAFWIFRLEDGVERVSG